MRAPDGGARSAATWNGMFPGGCVTIARVDDCGDGAGPHVQQPGQLTRPGAGMLGHHRQQLQLGHGQRVARAGHPGAAPQRPAQPGDAPGQPVGPGTGTARRAARVRGGHRGTAAESCPPARTALLLRPAPAGAWPSRAGPPARRRSQQPAVRAAAPVRPAGGRARGSARMRRPRSAHQGCTAGAGDPLQRLRVAGLGSSAFLDAGERASRTGQPQSRTKIQVEQAEGHG